MQRVNKQQLHGEEASDRAEAQDANTLTETAKQDT